MLYWKISHNRILFLNEYWVLIPLSFIINYVILKKIRSSQLKMEELERLKQLVERYEKQERLRRVFYLSCGLTAVSFLGLGRGGADAILLPNSGLIDVDDIKNQCDITPGVHFLENERLRKIVNSLYKHKRGGKIIYITATALCHLANEYGVMFFSLPFSVNDFGITSSYQFVRKFLTSILLTCSLANGLIYGITNPAVWRSVICAILGIAMGLTHLEKINMTLIDPGIPLDKIKPRTQQHLPEVVVINNSPGNKISIMTQNYKKGECWLPEQQWTNPTCKQIKLTDIPDNAIDVIAEDFNYLDYDKVVNMEDRTQLKNYKFKDRLDLGPSETKSPRPNLRKGKTVDFLDKFSDPKEINEAETWEPSQCEIPQKIDLKTKN